MNFIKNLKIKYLIMFVSVVIIAFIFSFFIIPVTGDEIWCYGFSYNISSGLIPYKDFSLLQTPLYFFVGSIFIKIFGEYLISIHILNALLVGIIFIMLFKMLGIKSLLLFPLFLLNVIPTCNYCCLFFLFILIYLIHKKKDNDLIVGFLIGLIFLNKQSIGVVMLLPLLFYSKKRIKSLCSFFTPLLIFLVYLVFNNALYEFMDYCFLGILDFGGSNTVISIFTCFWILQVIYIIILLIKTKFKDRKLLYILVFQVMCYPIFDLYHWLLSFVPFFYYLLREFNCDSFRKSIKGFLKFIFIVTICLISLFIDFSYLSNGVKIAKNGDNYLYLRNIDNISYVNLDEYASSVQKYLDEYEKSFFILGNSYMVKLYMDLEINKYDLLLDGNMGYNGDERYILEIDRICDIKSCIFFVEDIDFDNEYCQVSKVIYDYVINNYTLVDRNEYFDVYSN